MWDLLWPLAAGDIINRYRSGGSRTCSLQTLNLRECQHSAYPGPFLLFFCRSYQAGVRQTIYRRLSHSFPLFHPLPMWIAWVSDTLITSERCIISLAEDLSVCNWLKINTWRKNQVCISKDAPKSVTVFAPNCVGLIPLVLLYWGDPSQWF